MHPLTPQLFHSSQLNPQQLQHWKASCLALLVACSSLSPQEILFILMNSLNKSTILSFSFSSVSYYAVFAPNKHGRIPHPNPFHKQKIKALQKRKICSCATLKIQRRTTLHLYLLKKSFQIRISETNISDSDSDLGFIFIF